MICFAVWAFNASRRKRSNHHFSLENKFALIHFRVRFSSQSQFHQHFTSAFFSTKFWRQNNYKAEMKLQSRTYQHYNFWCQNIGEKSARKMLMKLTSSLISSLLHNYSLWHFKAWSFYNRNNFLYVTNAQA